MTKYPDIEVKLEDGDVDLLVSRIARALRKAEVSKENIREFMLACQTAEDFYSLMSICQSWVSIPDYSEFN